jgi:hypothetical protein
MAIEELRRILRAMGFNVRKRDMSLAAQEDCTYEVTHKSEPLFYINPEKYNNAEQVKSKVNYELREEYIPPLG